MIREPISKVYPLLSDVSAAMMPSSPLWIVLLSFISANLEPAINVVNIDGAINIRVVA
jgi:hypothetical protein